MAKRNQTPANGTAETTGETQATTTRNSRSNHSAAENCPITDVQSAQSYIDQVLADTANDEKEQANFNSSGFTTPRILNRQTPSNLLRMGLSISAALAAQVGEGGTNANAAADSLRILREYAESAGTLQEASRQFSALVTAARIQFPNFKGNNEELVDHMLSKSGTDWATIRAGIVGAAA